MPPVGTKPTSPNGAARAATALAPPDVPAGKNFTVVRPSSSAACTSVAVTAPGSARTPCSWQRSTTARLSAGRDDVGRTGGDGLVDLLQG